MAGRDKEILTYVKRCADCGSSKILIRDCRETESGSFRRRRVCSDCGYKFWTVEVEECISDVGGLLRENEVLRKENDKLKHKIQIIKETIGG